MNTLNKGFNYVEEGRETYPLAATFMSGVFLWMFLALALSAATAWLFASNAELMGMLYNMETNILIY